MLWALVSGPGGEDTARALVVLARLHVERLDLPDLGWTLYQRAVTEYPGTSAADFARARLAEAGKGG